MALDTITVRARLYDQDGDPAEGALICYTLDRYDFANGVVVPETHQAIADADGLTSVDLWPNSAGERNSHYKVQAVRNGITLLQGVAVFPAVAEVDLRHFLQAKPPTPLAAVARRDFTVYDGVAFAGKWNLLNPDGTEPEVGNYTPRLVVRDEPGGTVLHDSNSDSGTTLTFADNNTLTVDIATSVYAAWPTTTFYEITISLGGNLFAVSYGYIHRLS